MNYGSSALVPRQLPRTSAICLLLLSLASATVDATVIVGIKDGERVVLAADGLMTSYSGRGPSQGCKIIHAGSCLFALKGIFLQQSTGFDLVALANRASLGCSDLSCAVANFEKIAREPIRIALDTQRIIHQEDYIKYFWNTNAFDIMFACPDGRSTGMAWKTYMVGKDHTVWEPPVEFLRSSLVLVPQPAQVRYAGPHKQIMQYTGVNQFKALWGFLNAADAAEAFIQMEINGGSPGIGPPVAIAEISPAGIRWITAGRCADGQARQ